MLLQRKFLHFFNVQFLGAFNDNIYRNALAILITFRLSELYQLNSALYLNLAAALFILPFFIFSGFAGLMADSYDKSLLLRYIKFCEVIIMLLAAAGFYLENVNLLLISLFFMGTQSAFFGPIKYSILPFLLKKDEIIAGNAYISSSTFLAIIMGTLIGSYFILVDNGILLTVYFTVGIAVLGWLCSFGVPTLSTTNKANKITAMKSVTAIKQVFDITYRHPQILNILIAISWFWLMGAVILTQLPEYTKVFLYGNKDVVTYFLAIFCIGIAIGSFVIRLILRDKLTLKYTVFALIAMSLFMWDMIWTTTQVVAQESLIDLKQFLDSKYSWRISIDFILFSICGGLYTVPLYCYLQIEGPKQELSQIIATNNILNSGFMFSSVGINIGLIQIGFDVLELILLYSILSLLFAIFWFFKKKKTKDKLIVNQL